MDTRRDARAPLRSGFRPLRSQELADQVEGLRVVELPPA
jgi:hypothetical protein